jgi:hypothetical protein
MIIDTERAHLRKAKLPSCEHRFSIRLSQLQIRTTPGLREASQIEVVGSAKMGNGTLPDLRGRRGSRDRRFNYRAAVLILMILLTTVSCSTLPVDILAFDECDLSSGLVTDEQVLKIAPSKVRRAEASAKARREQPSGSATPKVVPVRATNATSRSGSGEALKKANTPPGLDVRREQQLFNKFLEWRNRQIGPL